VTFGGAWLATRSGGSDKTKIPPTNASSKDEESFIQYGSHLPNVSTPTDQLDREFVKSAEAEEKKAKH